MRQKVKEKSTMCLALGGSRCVNVSNNMDLGLDGKKRIEKKN